MECLQTSMQIRARSLGFSVSSVTSHMRKSARANSSTVKALRFSEKQEPAEYIYQVIEGAVRTHKLLADGRRQIGRFTCLAISSV